MGAPRKYSPKRLRDEVERYFRSITRIVTVTEKKDSGERDDKGHIIWEQVPVVNQLGEEVQVVEYAVPPTEEDLAAFLGIHRSTWWDYCNHEKHPEFSDTTTRARGRMEAYLRRELLTRPGKDIAGIRFQLEANYGERSKVEIELGAGTRKAIAEQSMSMEERERIMREIAEEIAGGR